MADTAVSRLPSGRFLVTGATGLVGRHVLDVLLAAGADPVTALYHRAEPVRPDPRVAWRRADLTNASACAEAVAGHDYVIHAAGLVAPGPVLARDPVGPIRQNIAITGNVLEAAWRAGTRRLVWFSSTTGYPDGVAELDEDRMLQGDPPDHWFGLGWAHRYLEIQSRMYAEKLAPAMDVVALRPTLIYGPRTHWNAETAHFVHAFVRKVVDRADPLEIRGDGGQVRDLVHVRDVARAAFHAVAHGSGYAAYNIAGGDPRSVREVLDLMLEIDAWPDAAVRCDPAASGVAPVRRRFPTQRAETELGFRPSIGLVDGLRDLIAHCRAQANRQPEGTPA